MLFLPFFFRERLTSRKFLWNVFRSPKIKPVHSFSFLRIFQNIMIVTLQNTFSKWNQNTSYSLYIFLLRLSPKYLHNTKNNTQHFLCLFLFCFLLPPKQIPLPPVSSICSCLGSRSHPKLWLHGIYPTWNPISNFVQKSGIGWTGLRINWSNWL